MARTLTTPLPAKATTTWWANERVWRRLALLVTLGFVVAYSAVGILKHQWFGYGWNMALYEQEIWNGAQGRFFQTSLWGADRSQLGLDLFLTQLLFIPFYMLGGQTTASLIVLQVTALGLGALPMYWLGRSILAEAWGGMVGVLVYLLLPAVAFLATREFDPRPFALVALLFAIYGYHRRDTHIFIPAILFALMSKSDLALPVFGFGVLALIERRAWWWRLVPPILAVGWLVFSVGVVVPRFSQTSEFQDTWQYLGYLGSSQDEIVNKLLTDPLDSLRLMWINTDFVARFWYWLALFGPLALLPFLGWRWLVPALPTLLFNTVSLAPIQWDIRSRHQAAIQPFLCVAALYGLVVMARLLRRRQGERNLSRVVMGVIVMLIIANIAYRNPLISTLRNHEPSERVAAARAILQQIPPTASVSASAFLLPHLVQRSELQIFMGEELDPNHQSLYDFPPNTEYFAADARSVKPLDIEAINLLRADPAWQLVDEREGFVLLRRH